MASHPFLPLLLLLLLLLLGSTTGQPSPPSDENYDRFTTNNFSSSTAAIIVILISAFAFLVFFSVYAHQCTLPLPSTSSSASRRLFAAAATAAARLSRRRGLDPALLETFPTMLYSDVKGLRTDKTPLECAVCLSEFADDETLRMLPPCNHAFHPDCIDAWLASHTTCPVCRSNLAVEPQVETKATSENHVTIDVEEGEEREEEEEEEHVLAPAARFPRSHTTGHDRYTLRLPERVMKEIVAAGRLRRAASCVAFPVGGEASGRRGYRGAGAGERSLRGSRSSRSHRWTRALSMRMTAWAAARRGEVAEVSASGVFPAAVKVPENGGRWPEHDGRENESSAAPLAIG